MSNKAGNKTVNKTVNTKDCKLNNILIIILLVLVLIVVIYFIIQYIGKEKFGNIDEPFLRTINNLFTDLINSLDVIIKTYTPTNKLTRTQLENYNEIRIKLLEIKNEINNSYRQFKLTTFNRPGDVRKPRIRSQQLKIFIVETFKKINTFINYSIPKEFNQQFEDNLKNQSKNISINASRINTNMRQILRLFKTDKEINNILDTSTYQ